MTAILYGIPNCDTVRKARAWLAAHDVDYVFHDYRKDGVDAARLRAWVDELGWETLLNRRGTTFRKLDAAVTAELDSGTAITLMLAYPAAIKRPVLDLGARRIVGFDPETYAAACAFASV